MGFWQISSRGERSSNYKAVFQIKPSSEGKKVTSVQDTKPVDTSELPVIYKKELNLGSELLSDVN